MLYLWSLPRYPKRLRSRVSYWVMYKFFRIPNLHSSTSSWREPPCKIFTGTYIRLQFFGCTFRTRNLDVVTLQHSKFLKWTLLSDITWQSPAYKTQLGRLPRLFHYRIAFSKNDTLKVTNTHRILSRRILATYDVASSRRSADQLVVRLALLQQHTAAPSCIDTCSIREGTQCNQLVTSDP